MHFAIARRQIIVEPQALEPGSLLQNPDNPRIIARQVGSNRLQGLDRPAQGLAMAGLRMIIGPPRHHEAEAEARDRHSHQDDGERGDDALNRGSRAGRRPVPD